MIHVDPASKTIVFYGDLLRAIMDRISNVDTMGHAEQTPTTAGYEQLLKWRFVELCLWIENIGQLFNCVTGLSTSRAGRAVVNGQWSMVMGQETGTWRSRPRQPLKLVDSLST